jgi:hypothetical protein
MTYTMGTGNEPVGREEVRAMFITSVGPTEPEGVGEYYEDHKDAIQKAVTELLKVVGVPEDQVMINISGHANPGHVSLDGFADELIQISVYTSPVKKEK